MQARTNQSQQPRGMQGRPDVKAREKTGEERVAEIFNDNRLQIEGLLANERDKGAAFLRAQALAVAAYRKAQADADADGKGKIDEQSLCTACIWAMRQKLDPGTEVWLVPYAGKITPIVSPDGMISLIMRSGFVTAVNYSAVFDGDYFVHLLGSTNKVKHRKTGKRPPALLDGRKQVRENPDTWNALVAVWCTIDLKSGGQIVVVFNKDELEYFRSLSPFGHSSGSPWAKYPDAMAEVRALKRAAKRAPKSPEVSAILLAAEDADGVEIPEEFMRAVGARIVADMTGEQSQSGATTTSSAEPPPNTQHSGKKAPRPGDPKTVFLPGTPPQPSIWDAPENLLIDAEAKSRGQFDDGKWNEKYWDKNAIQLATMRQELRERNLPVTPHAFFDAGIAWEQPEQVAAGNAEREPGEEG